MNAKFLLATIFLAFLCSLLVFQVVAADYSWRDDFNYSTIEQMQNAGWTFSNPSGVTFATDGIILDGTKADTPMNYIDHFPSGIENWIIEIRSSWPGEGHSQPAIYVSTDRHTYGFTADGWYSNFGFYRDGAKPLSFGTYQEQANVWVTLRLEKQANVLSMYCDGKLVNAYTESDTSSSQLTGVSTIAPWKGDEKYDYYQVASSGFLSNVTTTSSGFPVIYYVAVGVGIAAIAAGGLAAYYFLIAKHGAELAASGGGQVIDEGQNALLRDGRELAQSDGSQGSTLQSTKAENEAYLSHAKNSDLAASPKQNTISKAQNQPGQSDQNQYSQDLGSENTVEPATQVDSDKGGS